MRSEGDIHGSLIVPPLGTWSPQFFKSQPKDQRFGEIPLQNISDLWKLAPLWLHNGHNEWQGGRFKKLHG
jgi:hypothetical protein